MESATPGRGRHRDTKVAEKGSSVTAARASGRAPLTRSSNRDRIRVSRTKRPWAEPVTMSPARPLMAKVDSSTRVTTPLGLVEDGDLAGERPRIAHQGQDATGPPIERPGAPGREFATIGRSGNHLHRRIDSGRDSACSRSRTSTSPSTDTEILRASTWSCARASSTP